MAGKLRTALASRFGKTRGNKSVSIGTRDRSAGGFGYINIPFDLDRKAYIRNVMETGMVMITTSENQVIRDARVPLHILPTIKFPSSSNKVGSLIHWANVPKTNQVVITGVHLAADEFRSRRDENRSVEINGTANDKIIKIEDVGETPRYGVIVIDEADELGTILFKAFSTSAESEVSFIEVKANGTSEVYGGVRATMSSENELQLIVGSTESEKSTLTIKKDGTLHYIDRHKNYVKIEEKKVTVESKDGEIWLGGSASEQAILGNKMVKWLGDVIDAINALTVSTALGPSSTPINTAQFVSLKGQLQSLLSEKNKVE